MAYGNWDEVVETFERAVKHASYGELAQKMLVLVKQLKEHPSVQGMIPGTSLLTLFLELPGRHIKLNVIWYEEGEFRVYLDDPEFNVVDEKVVDEDHVIQSIEEYIDRLREI
jgi:hypothetical protein